MFDAVENFLAVAATYQSGTQFQLIMHDAERRLAVGTLRRECHDVRYLLSDDFAVEDERPANATQPSCSAHTVNAMKGA